MRRLLAVPLLLLVGTIPTSASARSLTAVDGVAATQPEAQPGVKAPQPLRTDADSIRVEGKSKKERLAPSARSVHKDRRARRDRKARRARRAQRRRAHRARRRRFVQLGDRPGLRVLNPKRAWGTQLVVSRLTDVFSAFREEFPEAPDVWVHDISVRWGGRLRPHKSHRLGRDVDIRVMLKRHTERYVRARPGTLHLERTWFIIQKLIETGDVEVIFLDRRLQRALYRYARRQGHSREELNKIFEWPRNENAIIRHWKGHADHLHVRFKRARPKPEPVV